MTRAHWLICGLALFCLASAAAFAAEEKPVGPPAVEVHGYMQARYYLNATVNVTKDGSGRIIDEEEDSRLRWERISLSGLTRLSNGKTGYAEIYIHPWLPSGDPVFLYLESLYLDVPAGPGAKFRIGKGRNLVFGITPAYGNRKTTNYSPLEEAFTMDRVLGIQYLQKQGDDEFGFGILNSQRPGARRIGMMADLQMDRGSLADTTVVHLCDRDDPAHRSGTLQGTARYGRQMGALNAGLSARTGYLDKTDAEALAKTFKAYLTERHREPSRTAQRYGIDATYNEMPFYGTFQYYGGTTGGIRSSGWQVLLGAEPSKQCTGIWRDMSPACKGLFLRYGEMNVGVPPTSSSVTWDTSQLAVSYVLPVRCKRLGGYPKWLQFEYEWNREDPPVGTSDIPNDVFVIELFTAF